MADWSMLGMTGTIVAAQNNPMTAKATDRRPTLLKKEINPCKGQSSVKRPKSDARSCVFPNTVKKFR